MICEALAAQFSDHLGLIPSSTGLHVAAVARIAPVERIGAIAQRAMAAGVAFQTLARFAASDRCQAGVVLGYRGIATDRIQQGLRILRKCFANRSSM